VAKEKKLTVGKIFKDGLLDQNPIFVQLLGMCSTLAVSTSVINGIGMGLSVTFVLILSNLFISVFRKAIPSKIRIASYIVIIAGFVTVVDMLLQAFIPSLASSLGLFIPLIVVNCLILARAESFASRHGPLPSLVDGLAMGLGYTVALVIISAIRELLGNGTLLGIRVLPDAYSPAVLVISPVGGFLILGALIALVEWIRRLQRKKKEG
jgi:electron transport complex protein RnfE